MTKREAPKQITKKNARLISLGMLALSLAIAFVCVKGMLTPIRYDVKVGEASSATILATCEAVDEINTEIMREKVRIFRRMRIFPRPPHNGAKRFQLPQKRRCVQAYLPP